MLKDCLMRDYESLGTDWCEEVFDSKDSKEPPGTAAGPMSWYLRITQRKAKFWRAPRLPHSHSYQVWHCRNRTHPSPALTASLSPVSVQERKAFFSG